MASDCYECMERNKDSIGDKRMLAALEIACGDGDKDTIKSVWKQLFTMGLVDKDKPPGYW